MRNFVLNKIVRDKILDHLICGGADVDYTILSGEEKIGKLKEKILEEAEEVYNAKTINNLKEELADLYEVMTSLMRAIDFSQEDFENKSEEKINKNGAFSKAVHISRVSLPDDSPMIKYFEGQPDKYPEF